MITKVLRGCGVGLLAVGFLSLESVSAAELTWGLTGAGGDGTWNSTATNWWNGSINVSWTRGTAVFDGTAGVVSGVFVEIQADKLVFNTPGYLLKDGWMQGGPAGLTITANADAEIRTTLSSSGLSGDKLVKDGSATLTVSGTNFFDKVEIKSGEYRLGGRSSLFFSDVVLADAPGVAVTLAQDSSFANMGSLSGGGVVRPDSRERTVELTLWGAGVFSGTLQDNGPGKLALDVFASSHTVTLSGVNTYSGDTTVSAGTLEFSGAGSLVSPKLTIFDSGTVRLNNSGVVNANRIPDSSDVTVRNGRLELLGHASTPVEENLGTLNYSGAAKVHVTAPGAAKSSLLFSSVSRVKRATLALSGNGDVIAVGLTIDASGILPPSITHGTEWARVTSENRVVPLDVYTSDINLATSAANVKLSGGGVTNLVTSTAINSLNLRNDTAGTATLNIASGDTLTLVSGGVLSSGAGQSRIQGGLITTAAGEFAVTNHNALTIDSIISGTTQTGLTKSGAGTLRLGGVNTFSGVVALNEGTLEIASDANLGSGAAIEFDGGRLRALGNFSSSKAIRGSATIETNGYSVAFSNPGSASISKLGPGALTVSNLAGGSVSSSEGVLHVPNALTGRVSVYGGSLLVSGTLAELSMESASILDIGGEAAASLTTASFGTLVSSSPKFTIKFDIGATASDFWTIGTEQSISQWENFAFLFDFRNLGGLTLGVNYPVMRFPSSISPFWAPDFALAPNLVQAGWNASFKVEDNGEVNVNFRSVPEPSTAMVLLGLLGCWSGTTRRGRRR